MFKWCFNKALPGHCFCFPCSCSVRLFKVCIYLPYKVGFIYRYNLTQDKFLVFVISIIPQFLWEVIKFQHVLIVQIENVVISIMTNVLNNIKIIIINSCSAAFIQEVVWNWTDFILPHDGVIPAWDSDQHGSLFHIKYNSSVSPEMNVVFKQLNFVHFVKQNEKNSSVI